MEIIKLLIIFLWSKNKDFLESVNCTLSVNERLYVENFSPGPFGIQPHNFVTRNGTDIKLAPRKIPKIENNFDWINKTEYKIEAGAIYENVSGLNVIINTKGASLSLIMLNEYSSIDTLEEIDYIYLTPFANGKLGQIINLSGFGKIK